MAIEAQRQGFAASGITAIEGLPAVGERLAQFIALGRQGDMDWLADTVERRSHPHALWPEARSAVLVTMQYGGADDDPLSAIDDFDRGIISLYAKRRDYHDVLKGRLKHLAGWLQRETGGDVKVFVDTAPLMEKPLAMAAGLGWQGRHTNLVSRAQGSWFLLGAILTTAELAPDTPEIDHCGSCRRCLDICPTDAFPAPYQLDARRCISYLTIEHKGHIARDLRRAVGNRIFGCDDCLAVCPWNKFAQHAADQRFAVREEIDNPPLADLLGLDDAAFRARFAGTPIKRTGRDRFLRNVLIAAGNARQVTLLPQVTALLDDPSPLVRAMAVWALASIGDAEAVRDTAERRLPSEPDPDVRREWQEALDP
ncbi:MAG: tRNA epoxyqueuosine(34) reductase QueG [Hyphomicrobiaceae bacterium]